jgi:hypothetical protein
MKYTQLFNEFLNESEVNEAFDSYHDMYIAKERFDMKIGNKTWDVAEGSVFSAAGGGWWRDANYDITGMQCGIDDIQNHAQYFELVRNSVWPTTIDTVNAVENWARETKKEVFNAVSNNFNAKKAKQIIDTKMKKLAEIRKLLK